MSDTAFPFDDPAWEDAPCAYGIEPIRKQLTQLAKRWDAEDADYLFFSALLHQDTVYPATFLALPHIVQLADSTSQEALGNIALFLGGVALHGWLPRTSGGVSLADGDPWAETEIGQRAAQVLKDALPAIAEICTRAYKQDPSKYQASGVAAALGQLSLARQLMERDRLKSFCPTCGRDNSTVVSLVPPTQGSTAPRDVTAVTEIANRLHPMDPVTSQFLEDYTALTDCALCQRDA